MFSDGFKKFAAALGGSMGRNVSKVLRPPSPTGAKNALGKGLDMAGAMKHVASLPNAQAARIEKRLYKPTTPTPAKPAAPAASTKPSPAPAAPDPKPAAPATGQDHYNTAKNYVKANPIKSTAAGAGLAGYALGRNKNNSQDSNPQYR